MGCSIVVFTKMLAFHFQRVTAIDVSKEALNRAAAFNYENGNIKFVRSTLEALSLGTRYDVIVCAEVRYATKEKDIPAVCHRLARHLDAKGILVTVGSDRDYNPDVWDKGLALHFKQLSRTAFEDAQRPYEKAVFGSKS